MKIGLVTHALVQQGGGERQLLYLAKGLMKKGHEIKIYTINYDKECCYPALARGLNIISLYPHSPRNTIPLFLSAYIFYITLCINLKRLTGIIDRDTDIINAHGEGMSWLALRLKPRWKGKFIWMCNDSPACIEVFKKRERPGLLYKFKNFFDRFIYRFISYYDRKAICKIDELVVLSKEMKQSLEFWYGRGVNILRSGIDMRRFSDCNGSLIRKRYSIMPQEFLLLHVSLLQPLRRLEDVILALAILKDNYLKGNYPEGNCPLLKFLIVGSLTYHPAYVESLKRLIKEKRLNLHVIFTGEVSEEELPSYYAACDGFIFSSDKRQSWGLVVFEAMASKKPVIVSAVCGASEVLKDESEALFITPGDISGITNRIKRIIENEEFRKGLAERGYNFVRENLSWQRYVERMEEIFLGHETQRYPKN